ncbi:MAG: carbohydrate kinase [Fimbriimonadaceae bacterium]|nr:carbohydrate kinase [Fimbriimonadaceae bacterium]
MEALALGELLVDLVSPDPDLPLAAARSFTKAPGGAPANVAVGLQRLGLRSGFCGCVGQDPFGAGLAAVLAAEGVDLRGLRRHPTARTTLAFVATRADGLKDIAFWRHPGADAQLSPQDLDPAWFTGLRLFHCCSVSLSREPARAATIAAARLARQAGALVSFDPNWRPALWDEAGAAPAQFAALLALSDVVKVADEELAVVCGTTDLDLALARLLAAGPRLAVITRGAAGAVAATATQRAAAAGFAVEAVDTLGAGDAFVAALLSRLVGRVLESLTAAELADLLRYANAAGALATLQVGALPALPTTAAVLTFLEHRKAC